MKHIKIEIDEEVYRYLQERAIAFVENPGMTLKRLLGLDKNLRERTRANIIRRRKPKTDLLKLIKNGYIEDGQTLYLRDFSDNRLPYQAILSGNSLSWEGTDYSMSRLAKILLQKEGSKSEEVQGPARWFTDDGVSIKQLWEQYLSRDLQGASPADT